MLYENKIQHTLQKSSFSGMSAVPNISSLLSDEQGIAEI